MLLSSRFVSLICFSFYFILIGHRLAISQKNFSYYVCASDQGSFTANSTYKANLDHLLSTFITTHQVEYGFYNFSYGQDSKAYAIGLCRGDIFPEICRDCLNNSINLLPKLCPNQREAIGWYDECMLRYADRSLFGFVDTNPSFYITQQTNASDKDRYTEVTRNLLQKLAGDAASGSSVLKFATGNAVVPKLPIIYGLVQCTPDLSQQDCNNCLLDAFRHIRPCCDGKEGGGYARPSCYFRFDSSIFYQTTPILTSPLPPPPLLSNRSTDSERSKGKSKTYGSVFTVVVPIVVVSMVLIISVCIFFRKTINKVRGAAKTEDETTTIESLQFDFNTIKIATNEFSDANKLGEGGFGAVYKGKLPDGKDIAVKRLSESQSQVPNKRDEEFKNEIILVAKLQHRNLVQLIGFSVKEKEKLLIYEFVQNSSLEKFILDPIKRSILDWEKRYKIIQGIVRGLIYLHEDSPLKIIHRDLKASNILLDAEMNAKISDFGTAKLFGRDQSQANSSKVVGTIGYMAPEYVNNGNFSAKSDVFSFGVLILEIVCGQKSSRVGDHDNVENLISYVWRNWQNGTTLNIVDSSMIANHSSRIEMARCIHVGLLCVQKNVDERPTMSNILLMLNSCSIILPTPSLPAFLLNSTTYSDMSSQSKDDSKSIHDSNVMSLTELCLR